jgi:hypothetical protein
MGEDSAANEGTELLLYEAGSGMLAASCAREEGLEALANDLVKKGSFGIVTLVLDGVAPLRDRGLQRDRSKSRAGCVGSCWYPREGRGGASYATRGTNDRSREPRATNASRTGVPELSRPALVRADRAIGEALP